MYRAARRYLSFAVVAVCLATAAGGQDLRALENSDLTKFPNAAYAKSFLLMYARYLGVDLKSVASEIDTTTQMKVEGYQYLTNRAAEPLNGWTLTFALLTVLFGHVGGKLVAQSALPSKWLGTLMPLRESTFPKKSRVCRSPAPKMPNV